MLGASGRPVGPPGWYPDPEVRRGDRYFDGQEWTDRRLPDWRDRGTEQSGPSSRSLALLIAGLVGLGGLSEGSRLMAAGSNAVGVAVLVVSQVFAFGTYLWPRIAKRL